MTAEVGQSGAYAHSVQKPVWQEILRLEVNSLSRLFRQHRRLLSVGCGTGWIEEHLAKAGFDVIGIDPNDSALRTASPFLHPVLADGQCPPFPWETFDGLLFVASLQFMEDPDKVVEACFPLLKKSGRMVALLLKPDSPFVSARMKRQDSYFSRLRHPDPGPLISIMNRHVRVHSEDILPLDEIGHLSRDGSGALCAVMILSGDRDAGVQA